MRSLAQSPAQRLKPGRPLLLAGIADGAEGLIIADLARSIAAGATPPAISLAVICRDGSRMAMLARSLAFFAPDIEVLEFPAWDCLPYDRVSPHPAVVAQRMMTLARLARVKGRERPAIVLTTVSALLQRVPPRETLAGQSLSAAPGNLLAMSGVTQWLELNGFNRAVHGARSRRLCGARRHRRSVRAGHGRAGAARFLRRHAGIDPQLRCRNAAHERGAARARSRADGGIPAHHRHHPAVSHRLCRGLRRGGA